jgi:hypothetical protein
VAIVKCLQYDPLKADDWKEYWSGIVRRGSV